MDFAPDELIRSLREALRLSPDNVPLRRQLAVLLMSRGELDDADGVLHEGLTHAPQSEQLRLGLAECFRRRGRTSEALVIFEDLAARPDAPASTLRLLAELLEARGETQRAASAYRRAIDADPDLADPVLAGRLGIDGAERGADAGPDDGTDTDTDADGRVRLRADAASGAGPVEMQRPGVTFADVGGMDGLKEQVRLKIIAPFERPELFAAYGRSAGGGILMYGPPGCGKTHLARATAGQIDAGFINVGIHDVLDMYMGEGEKKLHRLFEHARAHRPCVLFFDEADALGMKRSGTRPGSWSRVVNQFLAELDGVERRNDGLLVLAATNEPWSVDPAFRRPGRFDRVVFVPPPDAAGAVAILRLQLRGKPQEAIDADAVARRCDGFSGADLKAVVDHAVDAKLRSALDGGVPAPLTTADLLQAVKQVRPSTREWFATARNHARYANEGGQYDDLLAYLGRR